MIERFSFLTPEGWKATYDAVRTHDGSGGAPISMDLPQRGDKKERYNTLQIIRLNGEFYFVLVISAF